MALLPYDPFRQLYSISKDFNRFLSDLPTMFGTDQSFHNIRIDIHENDHEVVATCDLPGLEKKEDVTIDIDNQTLMISGTIQRDNESKDENYYRKERFVGHFHRSVLLPSPVSHEGVKASYKNGVLEIRMPKLKKSQHKKIDIEFH